MIPGWWELWVTAWSFVATIAVVLALGWAVLRWWEWVTDYKRSQDKSR